MRFGLPAKLTATAMGLTLAAASLVFAAAAGASAPGAPQGTISVSITTSPVMTSPVTDNPAAVACRPKLNAVDRFQLCYDESLRVNVLRNHTQVGHATFIVTHALQLSNRSRDFAEHIVISKLRLFGEAGGIEVALGIGCDTPCVTTKNTFPVGKVLANGLQADVGYRDDVAAGHSHKDSSKYEWLFMKPGFSSGNIMNRTVLDYRCDDAIKGKRPGCVFPEFFPVMTSMKQLPAIAANIRRIQNHSPGHYGRLGSKHPLHHITDTKRQDKKRRQACSRRVTGPPPPGKSCDEYPFATTAEGGTALPPHDHGFAFVPTSEQDRQGGIITAFYNADRVLNGDAFWVSV